MSPNHKSPRTRLYVTEPLGTATEIELDEKQSHYLLKVLRQKTGDLIAVFNGNDGEWLAAIHSSGKKHVQLQLQKQQRPQASSPDLWLIAAPLKNSRTETVVEQATELGISRFIPVETQFTVIDRVNQNRLTSIATEAAEQSERMDVPVIDPLIAFDKLLANWDPARKIIYGDESGASSQASDLFSSLASNKIAILIGPEGGFSSSELASLREMEYACGMCMGPRILRAGTAAITAIALLQSRYGDWDKKPAFRNQE